MWPCRRHVPKKTSIMDAIQSHHDRTEDEEFTQQDYSDMSDEIVQGFRIETRIACDYCDRTTRLPEMMAAHVQSHHPGVVLLRLRDRGPVWKGK